MSNLKHKPTLTIFTPAYNRAYTLHLCYESMLRQNNKDFEWLIVDDGSTDNTRELVENWMKADNGFNIRYIYKENGGMHTAHNTAYENINTELNMCIDSDDYLTDDALYKLDKWEKSLDKSKKFAGIVANIGHDKGKTINNFFKGEYLDLDLLQRYDYTEDGKKVLDGERAYIFYTDIHRKYKYPEFEGEKFMTEAVVWNRMAHDGYLVRYYNDIIWIFEYLDDGLTKAGNKLFLDNPRGYTLWLKEKNIFQNKGKKEMLKFYYSMYCELNQLYSINQIADFLDTNKIILYLISFIKSIKSKI